MSTWTSPDGKIKKDILKAGEWGTKPYDWSECQVTIRDNILFKDFNNMTVIIGDNNGDLWRLLDICLSTMFVGEISKFHIDYNNDILTLVIELHSLKFNGFIYEWDAKKKYEIAVHHKNEGKKLFDEKNYKGAAFRFTKGLKIISSIPINVEEVKNIATIDGVALDDINSLKANLYNNLSSCYFRKNHWNTVIEMCNKVLDFDLNNVKALYKLGVAYENDRNYEKADEVFSKLLQLDPENKAGLQHANAVKLELKKAEVKVNDMMKKMFVGAMQNV